MMIVQKVEFFEQKICNKIRCFQPSVSLLSCIISVLFSLYVDVIYMNCFKRSSFTRSTIPLCMLTLIGNMTNPESSDIRNLSPYPL